VDVRSGDYDHTIEISEDEVARDDQHFSAFHGDVIRSDDSAANRIDRLDSCSHDRESELLDFSDIADQSIDDCAMGASCSCRCRQEFTPWGISLRLLSRDNHNLAGQNTVEGLDLQRVRFRRHMIDIATRDGSCPAEESRALADGAQVFPHSLVSNANLVQGVGNHGCVELVSYYLAEVRIQISEPVPGRKKPVVWHE